jgi:hypothetical protein
VKTSLLSYRRGAGWSPAPDGALDSGRTLVLVFGARELAAAPEPLRELVARYPQALFLGCSSAGEIHGGSVSDDTLTAAVVRFSTTTLRAAFTPVSGAATSGAAGEDIARQLLGRDLRAVLVVSDGLNVNGSELIRGLNRVLPASVMVTGGLAADGDRFRRTWVLREGRPVDRWISAVGMYGPHLSVGCGSRGGWDLFGPARRVTRSSGNKLFELDGRPALDLYKAYLGDLAVRLPANARLFPLGLHRPDPGEARLVRTVLSVDEGERSLTFAGDVPEGGLVRMMRANPDRLIDGASEAARRTRQALPAGQASLTIAISCVGRRLVLGARAEDEVGAVASTLPPGSPLVGFYSYGELSPRSDGRCELYNQTMTVTSLAEG